MTTFNIITLGTTTTLAGFSSSDQIAVNSHGIGNALGNALYQEFDPAPLTLAQFISGLTLERGHTYVAHVEEDPDFGGMVATFVVTETQSGKIGALQFTETVGFASINDHVLSFA
jgi:hypothetical protein